MSFTAASTGGKYNIPGITGTGNTRGLSTGSVAYGGRIPALNSQYTADVAINITNIQPYISVYMFKRTA